MTKEFLRRRRNTWSLPGRVNPDYGMRQTVPGRPACRTKGVRVMCLRFAHLMGALLIAGISTASTAAAKPERTTSFEILDVLDDSCENYFVVAGVTWTGFRSDGDQSVIGTFTDPERLDTITDVSIAHSRKSSRTGPAIIIAVGPFPEGSRIGADVTLLFKGDFVEDTFVDFGTCT